jgi:phosphopantothenoylcysteine decarboxylase/phosphopantothenate--cysteine ligase
MLTGRTILLIISGGIAAYKALELLRLIKKDGGEVRCILTKGGSQFITPLSVAALSGHKVYDDLWSLTDETEMGHIQLSRSSDLIVVAPASADIMAKMAHGRADDLASTVLLASNKPILLAPAMNPAMWENAATQANITTLRARGFLFADPACGEMACGETGLGRMAEPAEILASIQNFLIGQKPLAGKRAIVTSGPTYEPIDPVRFIGNRSSGKQGHAIAQALADAGAAVTLISGPVSIPDPHGVKTLHVETAEAMQNAVMQALPADIAVFTAAVSDWRVNTPHTHKMKKRDGAGAPTLTLTENPDILRSVANLPQGQRPTIVVGFAAETDDVIANAQAKLKSKACDMILANDVSNGGVFGAQTTHIYCVRADSVTDWGVLDKLDAAQKLAELLFSCKSLKTKA